MEPKTHSDPTDPHPPRMLFAYPDFTNPHVIIIWPLKLGEKPTIKKFFKNKPAILFLHIVLICVFNQFFFGQEEDEK